MELRHLRYFVAVAEEGNFTTAAKRLHVAQPALSQQIRHLEEELDVSLLMRDKRPVRLSPAGESFFLSARRILAEAKDASDAARRAARGEVGRLSLGFVCLASSSILTKLVREYRKKHPGVHLTLHEMPPATQTKALAGGQIQIGYTRRFDDPLESFDFLEIFHDRYLVALPAGHPLATGRRISLARLATEDFIIFKRADTPSFYNQVFTSCVRAGFSPRIVSEPDVLQTILIMVDAGMGVSVVPSCVSDMKHNGVVLVPLIEKIEPHPVVLAWVKNQENPVISAFLDVARAHQKWMENKILPPKWSRYTCR